MSYSTKYDADQAGVAYAFMKNNAGTVRASCVTVS
jgi:hypothetical protein